ncbi:ATP-grasp domain-containing protein [Cytobacillus gottheilii]|uniref:ATP-grasp domain-containing protein n=1 Tax=Cytobacillus gottheilii TaxID=859144 RepID=UPI002494E7BA|nr:ATP-grasp domain-containing protein [Cytobacillus gottheilii]
MNIKTVLVTGARSPAALHLCRLLNEAGVKVYGADSDPFSLTKSSNSIEKFILLPSAKFAADSYIEKLNKMICTYNIELIIPTCEETFYLSKKAEHLTCPVFAGDFKQLELLHNKYTFIQLAESCIMPVPKTNELSKDAVEDYSKMPNGFILKRKFTRFSDHIMYGDRMESIPSELFEDTSEWIIQERLTGVQYCSYSIALKGEVLAHSVYKAEYTAGEGASLHFQHVPRPDIEDFVLKIVKTLQYSGQISFDFIVNESDQAIPIECNPRTTSGIHLFGTELIEHLQSKHSEMLYPRKEIHYMISAAMLLYGYSNIRKTKKTKEWLKIMFTSRDIIFNMKDIKPLFYQSISLINIWRQSRKNSVSILTQSTLDICWDGEEF